MEEMVSSSEQVARFIMQKSYYRPSDQTVRHNAFMPNRKGKTSVYRIFGLDDVKIFEIGHNFVGDKMEKPLLGRADIVVSEIQKKDLSVKSDPEPHPRHANIVDWPEDKSRHKLIALELSVQADLHLLHL